MTTLTATGKERTTYAEWADRTRRLASALDALGISADGRVATFAWNTARHLELYFAAPCSGRVLHTLNIRLFPEQVSYIVDHAEDEVIFVDRSLVATLWPLVDGFKTVRHIVVMDDGAGDVPEDDRILALRGAAGRRRAGRVRGRGREPGRRHVLHERHHGPPEGRRLLAPLERAALDRGDAGRHRRGPRARRGAAGGADVPRQRVGPRARGRDGGQRVRVPRAADDAEGDRRS